MIMEPKQAMLYNYFDVFLLLYSYCVINMIKKLELHLLVDIILFKTEFGYVQISVPKIGTPMLKYTKIGTPTACIKRK